MLITFTNHYTTIKAWDEGKKTPTKRTAVIAAPSIEEGVALAQRYCKAIAKQENCEATFGFLTETQNGTFVG